MLQPGRRVLLVEEEEEAERWGIRALLPNMLCMYYMRCPRRRLSLEVFH